MLKQIQFFRENTMKFYKKLYVGDTVSNPGKTKRKLKKYAKHTNVYVIAYVEKDRRLEIYHSLMLQQYYYKENQPFSQVLVFSLRKGIIY